MCVREREIEREMLREKQMERERERERDREPVSDRHVSRQGSSVMPACSTSCTPDVRYA